jgi:ankyrin repeat protein
MTTNMYLYISANRGRFEDCKDLIEIGADVNYFNGYDTSLHQASIYGHFNICKLLLENGANINAKDKYGNTPADLICYVKKINGSFCEDENYQEIKNLFNQQIRFLRRNHLLFFL